MPAYRMPETTQLLQRWRDGDRSVIGDLVGRQLPFVRARVRDLLGDELRRKVATDDVVQEAMVEFLSYGPRFVPANERQLGALLARIVANTICDQGAWFRAARRRMAREAPLGSTAELVPAQERDRPDEGAAHGELTARLRLAVELLPERDRQAVLWREWEKLPFAELGSRWGMTEEGARTVHRRAITRLREVMTQLRHGDVDGAIAE